MKSWRIVAILLLILALTGATACNLLDGEEEATQQLVEVVRGDLTVTVSGSGNTQVSDEVQLVFGTGGKVAKIYVDEGDEVTEGEVLAKLDTRPLELALLQAQAALLQAEVSLQEAGDGLERAQNPYTEEDIEDAEEDVEEAQEDLDDAEERLEEAKRDGDLADIWYYRRAMYIAKAELEAAEDELVKRLVPSREDELETAQARVDAAESQLEVAEEAVAEAQRQLDEATITAPFNGLVAGVYAKEGDIIPSPTMSPQTIIYLIDLTTMELKAEVDEIDIAEVKPGQRAIIEIDALPDVQFGGEVIFISTLSVEAGGVVLYEVKISLDVPEGYEVKVGMSATADIVIAERSNVLLVPDRAIKEDSQGNPMVMVMVNEEIEERPVVTGISDGFETEIVDGLDEGEVVVERRGKS